MADQEKVQATIKQLVRDWSVEGAEERNACYQPIIDEILCQFPLDKWYDNVIKRISCFIDFVKILRD